jgi:hypothetical protein
MAKGRTKFEVLYVVDLREESDLFDSALVVTTIELSEPSS